MQGFLRGFNGDAELLQVVGINNLGLEVFQIVSVSLMLVEIAHFNGLFHVTIIIIIFQSSLFYVCINKLAGLS